MNLIAYKENNKLYKLNLNSDNNLILNYSLKFKLKMIGYTSNKYIIKTTSDIISLIQIRYNKIIDVIQNFIKIVTKINNDSIDIQIYKESFHGLKIILPKLDKFKKVNINIKLNENNFIIDKNKIIYNLDEINEIVGINKCTILLNYFCKFLIKIYKLNNNNNVILSFIVLFINLSFDELMNSSNNNNKTSYKKFNYYQEYNRYINDMLYADYLDEIIEDSKILFGENFVSPKTEDKKNIDEDNSDLSDFEDN
jgi:hypothetical protein